MALTNKSLCSGTLTDSNSTLYTAPASAGNYSVVKSLIICNKTSTSKTVTIKFNSVDVISTHTINPYDTIVIPFADAILGNGQTIQGSASANTSVNYYISGIESA